MGRAVKKAAQEGKSRLAAIKKVAAGFAALKPASQVLTRVRAVPTCFVQFDHAVRVGGFPTERFSLVHGPSSHGKTTFTLGLIKAFARAQHFAFLVDAERTTPMDWIEKMCGADVASFDGFVADRPESYESTIGNVRNFCLSIAEAKDKGSLPEDTSGIIVVDSIRKLVPKKLLDQILGDTKGEEADLSKRAAQIKAAMNANWLDELVPILERSGVGMVAIAREMEDPDASPFSKKFGTNYKIGGGGAIYYDASLVMRVERASYVTDGKGGEGSAPTVYGERHRVTIRKTKVAGKDDKVSRCYFHTSNGVLVPEGFDEARDILELAIRFGIAEKKGASISFDGRRLAQGENNAVKALYAAPDTLAAIEREVRAEFANNKVLEEDADGVTT